MITQEKILYALSDWLSKKSLKKNLDIEKVQTILVVKWDEIGDMATATHVFELLKQALPQSQLTLLCKSFVAPLLENNPHIDHVLTDFSDWSKYYDVVVDLRGTFNSLIKTLRQKPQIYLCRGSIRLKNKREGGQTHELETNFNIIKPLLGDVKSIRPRLYPSADDEKVVGEFLAKVKERFVVMHCGARSSLRQWPAAHFANLSEKLDHIYGLQSVLVATEEEKSIVDEISSLSSSSVYRFIDYSLLQLQVLIKQSALFIGNESGPLHIALTTDVPVVALFSTGVKHVFYPYREPSRYIHPLDKQGNPYPNSIQDISVDEVLEKIQEIVN